MRKTLSLFIFILALAALQAVFFQTNQAHAVSQVETLSNSSNDVVFPQVVADDSGYLHVSWMEVTPNQSWSAQNPGIFYARWNGDTWSAPQKISNNNLFAENPSITTDSTNVAHVVWDEKLQSDNSWRIHYKTRATDGTWSSTETLPLVSGTTVDWSPKIAADNNDVPLVAFTANTGGSSDSIYWSRKTSGTWSTPELLSVNASSQQITDSQWVDLKTDSSGNIHAVYWSWSQGVFYREYSQGTWSTPVEITTGSLQYPRIAVTPLGEVFVTWYDRNNDSIRVRWTQSGIWQAETTLTTVAQDSFWGYPIMGVTTDSKERTHVGWGERDDSGLIDLRYRSFVSGTWQPVQDVDLDNNDADSPFIYPDKWDNQHFAWTELNPSTDRWELKYRVAEGTIQSVGTSGGTVTADPFGTTQAILTFPSGALSSTESIGVQIGPVPESVDPTQVTLPRAFTFRPHGLTFNSTVTSEIFYTDAELEGADERQLKPWFWDSTANSGAGGWVAQDGTVRTGQNTIIVDLLHFSLYGISAPKLDFAWLSPLENELSKEPKIDFSFNLGYVGETEFLMPRTPDELKVVLKNSEGEEVNSATYRPGGITGGDNDTPFTGSVVSKGFGEFKLEIYLAGKLIGERSITIEKSSTLNSSNE